MPNYQQEAHPPDPIDGFNPLEAVERFGITTKAVYFAEWYLITMNITKAARKAGYAFPAVDGNRLLSHVGVRKYLDFRYGERKITPSAILDRLENIAYADISDYLIVDPKIAQLKNGVAVEVAGKVLDGIWLDLRQAVIDGNTTRIKTYKRLKGEIVIELHDPVRALELLGRHYRLFADVTVQSDKPDGTADVLSDERLAAIAMQSQVGADAPIVVDDGISDDGVMPDDQ